MKFEQRVHISRKKTTVNLMRRANNQFAADIGLVFTITGQPVGPSNVFIRR